MKILDLRQRTTEWHAWRNTGVSASEASIVMGLSVEKTKWRLWAEKKGIVLPEDLSGNPHVQRGIRCEPIARRLFEDRHNEILLPVCAESLQHPFLRASFDGLMDDGTPVEIKAPMEENFREAQANGVQSDQYRKHWYQVQQQIAVTGADKGWLTLYLEETREYLDFEVPRDDAFIAQLVAEARLFSDSLVYSREPEKDPLLDIFIPSGEEELAWLERAAEYRRISESIKTLKAKEEVLKHQLDAIESQLVRSMGEFTQAESAGLRVNRYLQQGPVNYKEAIKRFAPGITDDDLRPFRKPATERVRVTLKREENATVPFSIEALDEVFEDDWSSYY